MCVACLVVFVGLVVSFFWRNLISITDSFQLLTDHVSHLSGNAGKKKMVFAGPATDRIFVLQIVRFVVLTEPAPDNFFWELHFVRLMVSARPAHLPGLWS